MAKLTRNHTFTRPVTLKGISEDGKDVTFLTTFRSLPDEELKEMLDNWHVGLGEMENASQKVALEKVIAKVECKEQFDTPEEAREFVVNGNFPVRTAFRLAYQRFAFEGDMLQKN